MEGKVILGYWKIRGLVNHIKTVLEYLQVPYEFVAYEQGEGPEFSRDAWYSKKHTLGLDFPNLPYLIDGTTNITETQSIIYYICEKYGPHLLGKNSTERGQVHELMALLHSAKMSATMFCYRQDSFEEVQKAFTTAWESIRKFYGNNKFFVGDSLTVVDLHCWETFLWGQWVFQGKFFESFPEFQPLWDHLNSLENLQKYKSSDRWLEAPFNNKSAKLNTQWEKPQPLTLGYWKIRGLAHHIRTFLEYIGVPYNFVAYEQGEGPEFSGEAWLSQKFNLGLDFPNLPYLIDGDKNLSETQSIIYYICDKYAPQLLGSTPQQKAQVHELLALLHSAKWNATMLCYQQDNLQEVAKKLTEGLEPIRKFYGNKFFFVGNSLTAVDLYCWELFSWAQWVFGGKFFYSYPEFKGLWDHLNGLEGLQNWKASDRWMEGPFNNKVAKLNTKW